MKKKLTKICQYCGKRFEKPYHCSKKNWLERKFCSRECQHKGETGIKNIFPRSKEYKEKQRIVHTGVKRPYLSGEKHFYFGKHRSSDTKRKIAKTLKGHSPSEEARRKMIKNNAHYWKGKHCSEEKKEKLRQYTKERSSNWQGGISFEPYGSYWTKEYKAAIRQRDNFTCALCGKYPSFIVHHKDYNKKNPDPKMKIILCPICHGKTNFNRKYWIKYFSS